MLAPHDFFDLADFEHRALFEGAPYVWDALKGLEEYLTAALDAGVRGTVLPGAWVDENVFIGEGTVVEPGAMVKGPAIIGDDCQLRHGCYLRGEVIIGKGAVVGHGSELRRAILLHGARAAHHNYVGDTIVGTEANLGAGSVCSNRKVTRDHIVVRVNDREYDTGLARLGAVLGDGVRVGANSSLAPGTLIGKRSLVYHAAALRGYYPPHSIIKTRPVVEVVERRPSGSA